MNATPKREIVRMALGLLLGLTVTLACGGNATVAVQSPAASRTPAPTPTAAQILGSWQVIVTTTKVSGPVPNKVGETYDRTFVFSPDCSAPSCVATLNTMTANGPVSMAVAYSSREYRAAFGNTAPCPNSPGNIYGLTGTYVLTPTNGTVSNGRYQATTFAGTFVEDVVVTNSAAAAKCPSIHVEQDLAGTRTA